MQPEDQQTLLIAVYKENCDQARHHEVQRERVTAIVGQTTGLILGLFGFSTAAWNNPKPIHLVIPLFLILLGLWGFAASWKHNERSDFHRERIRHYRKALAGLSGVNLQKINDDAEKDHTSKFGKKAELEARTHIIWKAFNLLIMFLGLFLLVYLINRIGI